MALNTSGAKMCRVELLKFNCNFEVIYLSVMNNVDYFFFAKDKYWYGEKFVSLLRDLLYHLHWYEDNLTLLYDEAHRFDLDEKQGNGFRSFILIFERCFTECYKYSKRLNNTRGSIFFRVHVYLKEMESLVNILSDLRPTLNFLIKMLRENTENYLLMAEKALSPEEIITQFEGISQLGFYGRYQGFYYCTSMQRILQGVSVIVATFSDLYQKSGGPIYKAVLTVLNGIKYVFNPELRAHHIVSVAQNSSVEFLKAFWSLSEVQLMKRLPDWICPKLAVREEMSVPSTSLNLNNIYTDLNVVIPVPTSHIPPEPVRCLLLSSVHREGQVLKDCKSKTLAPKSKSLLFHCHGGGFIAQDPDSHEIYLRHWASNLNVPIISIDYSLSPEAPFPRALEEVLLVYAWVLKNPHKLGWTGETICFAGDSAGGNVLMSTVLKTISLQIRQPDAVLCCYTPLVLDIVPSPSRLLCWIDPLLPIGFMISCLDAYAGAMTTEVDEYDTMSDQISAGRRSRKISSISEIFDSSMSFLKQCEWTEVEANEPPEKSVDITFYSSKNRTVDGSNYIHDFIKKYDDDGTTKKFQNESLNHNSEFNIFNFPQDLIFDLKAKSLEAVDLKFKKISEFLMCTSLYQKFVVPFFPNMASTLQKKPQFSFNKKSIFQKMKKLKIVSKNPFMSPLLASDDILKEMPPIYFVSLNFDPCLDDSVAFTKRLRSLNRQVTIDFLDGLPHGFLNFLPFSQEAHNGSNLCVQRLKEAMKLV